MTTTEQLCQDYYACDFSDSLTTWFPNLDQSLIAHPLYLHEYNGHEDASITFFFIDINGLLCEILANDAPCYHHNENDVVLIELVSADYVQARIVELQQQ